LSLLNTSEPTLAHDESSIQVESLLETIRCPTLHKLSCLLQNNVHLKISFHRECFFLSSLTCLEFLVKSFAEGLASMLTCNRVIFVCCSWVWCEL